MPVADAELRDALSEVLRRPVHGLARSPHPYGSSHLIENVGVRFEDGTALRLVFKDVSAPTAPARGAKPPALLDRDREIEAYTRVLGPAGLDVAACHGALARRERRWLFLEAIDGSPLWQTGDEAVWEQAARWLAALHECPLPPPATHLLHYDAPYLRGWLARAVALTPAGALDRVAAVWDRVVRRLCAWPRSVVHGDYHPSNILVCGAAATPRIRPVDWELAGIGPGLLDLAALTSGAWRDAARERVALAYHDALDPATRPAAGELLDALAHCRLFLAVQWLGWSRAWSPPAEHRHDWLAEAVALAEELLA
ncbi:MAG TPA: aminoglycoside phosphotransferase family protein [Solirubrobacteraceae bacterium]|nr:aminoglycoside phosphotransferase family protein [Solirubrobacteraceae bacterium]